MSSSIRELAKITGLSTATVSMALSGKGRVAPATREKVKMAAQSLDYQAHPIFSKAFSLARLPDTSRFRDTIAFLTEYPINPLAEYQKQTFDSARDRAREIGYKLEPVLVSGKPSEQRRLSRIFQARGIRGLIIIPRLGHRNPRLYFDWQNFVAVEVGGTLRMPRNLHRVQTSSYNKLLEAIHLLKRAGFRRVGMAVEPTQNNHEWGSYNATYLLTQMRLPTKDQIPPLSIYGPWGEPVFRRWIETFRPDVLFVHDAITIHKWVRNMGMSIPDDISLFCADVRENAAFGGFRPNSLSGLRRDYAGMGRSAVEMLSLLLESGEMGLVGNPRCWQVDEFWQAGETLKRPVSQFITEEGFLKSDLYSARSPQPRAGD